MRYQWPDARTSMLRTWSGSSFDSQAGVLNAIATLQAALARMISTAADRGVQNDRRPPDMTGRAYARSRVRQRLPQKPLQSGNDRRVIRPHPTAPWWHRAFAAVCVPAARLPLDRAATLLSAHGS